MLLPFSRSKVLFLLLNFRITVLKVSLVSTYDAAPYFPASQQRFLLILSIRVILLF